MLTTLRQIVESVTAPSLSGSDAYTGTAEARAAMHVDCCSVYISETQRQCYRLVVTDGLSLDAVGKPCCPLTKGWLA